VAAWVALMVLAPACSDAPNAPNAPNADGDANQAEEPQARSTEHTPRADPGLGEARPSPLQVELRRRDGTSSTLLRVADEGIRLTLGHGQHDVTVQQTADAQQLDDLWAALLEQAPNEFEQVADPEADVDGTSLRILAGRRRISASRMGHFTPKPEQVERYDACVSAVESLLPSGDGGHPLSITFDPSMAERRLSLEVDVGTDLLRVEPGPPVTVVATQPRVVTLKLRYGPPIEELSATVDLATSTGVTIAVDPELNTPTITTHDG